MCGFAGVVSQDEEAVHRSAQCVERMVECLRHRGPDSDGVVSAPFARVGFRRLSIVDLETGDQPVTDERRSFEVFLNGEIFNYLDLRRDLVRRGHVFRTHGDAEVIPHLYEEEGPSFVHRLNGMFAICIVDRQEGRVLLYRDRLGVKPLFYTESGGALLFASELKALVASQMFQPEVDAAELLAFLQATYCPGPNTLLRGVRKLQPGEMLEVGKDGRSRTRRYYRLPLAKLREAGPPDLDEVDAILDDSVRRRLVADVPVGISLSGGLDSSLITMYAARAATSDLSLFTVHFEGTPRVELDSATAVARHFGLRHETLTASTTGFLDEAPRVIWMNDEPVADPAYYPATKVAEAASTIVKVLLSGTGADELFAGYGHYRLTTKKRLAVATPRAVLQSKLVTRLLERMAKDGELPALEAYRVDRLPWHSLMMRAIDSASRERLGTHLRQARDPDAALRAAFEEAADCDAVNQQLYADVSTYLADQLLPVLDRSTMAASIEGRVPFLDYRVAELAFRIPGKDKIGRRGEGKAVLRKLGAGTLPPAVLERSKLGFPNAVLSWLQTGLGELLPSILQVEGSLVDLYLPRDWIDDLLSSQSSVERNWRTLYSLLVLQIWYEVVVRRAGTQPPEGSLADLFEIRAAT